MENQVKKNQPVKVGLNNQQTPIFYTDSIFMHVNEDGVILDVCQRVGPNQLQVITRVGMSVEHAKRFVEKLKGLLTLKKPGQTQTGKGLIN